MNEMLRIFGPAGIVVIVLGGMLKYLVVDKLEQITEGLTSHEKRIRRMENRQSALHGALQAKGCLMADTCPATGDEPED